MVGITQNTKRAVQLHFLCGPFKKEWLSKVTSKQGERYYRDL